MAGSSSSVGGAIFDNLETRNFIFQQICETVLFFEPYEEYGMKKNWLKLCLSLVLIAGFGFQSVLAEQGIVHTLIPTGSDYRADTLERFAQAAVQRDNNGIVDLLVLPITYGTDAYSTTNGERQKNLDLADG